MNTADLTDFVTAHRWMLSMCELDAHRQLKSMVEYLQSTYDLPNTWFPQLHLRWSVTARKAQCRVSGRQHPYISLPMLKLVWEVYTNRGYIENRQFAKDPVIGSLKTECPERAVAAALARELARAVQYTFRERETMVAGYSPEQWSRKYGAAWRMVYADLRRGFVNWQRA